jgi:gluconate 2-dehydrogenase gamma chain
MSLRVSRRSILKRAAAAGAATAVPARLLAQAGGAGEPYTNLTTPEAETLEAIVVRLIPDDANGPGALEAGAVRYIDLGLSGALAPSRETYTAGLAAVDERARAAHGRRFAELEAADQDALLESIEQDDRPVASDATSFPVAPSSFFDLVLEHTIEGTFCDPHYGGNRDFIGWEMLGYPGIRLAVTAADQAMDARTAPTRVSAYDLPMFDTDDAEPGA